jgi:hypothetical protein
MASGFVRELLEPRSLGRPRYEPWLFQIIDAERTSLRRGRLFPIGANDFEVAGGAECKQRISRTSSRMLTARRGTQPDQTLHTFDARLQIGRGVHEVIDPEKDSIRPDLFSVAGAGKSQGHER